MRSETHAERMNSKMNVFRTLMIASSIMMLMCSIRVSAQELPQQWELAMSYEGGYSPVKSVEIRIRREAGANRFEIKRTYYEEENRPAEQRSGSLSDDELAALISLLNAKEVWTLADLEEYVATDGFTYTIQVREAVREHRFRVYFPQLQDDKRYASIVEAVLEAVKE